MSDNRLPAPAIASSLNSHGPHFTICVGVQIEGTPTVLDDLAGRDCHLAVEVDGREVFISCMNRDASGKYLGVKKARNSVQPAQHVIVACNLLQPLANDCRLHIKNTKYVNHRLRRNDSYHTFMGRDRLSLAV